MQITAYHEKLLPSLTRLINQQMALVPPGITLSEAQVAHTVEQGASLWRIHNPDDKTKSSAETLCVLERREVVAAAQWIVPQASPAPLSILWLVAAPGRPMPLQTLLHMIDKQVQTHHCAGISQGRCSFGVGWFGIPTTWTHVLSVMREAGYKRAQTWLLMRSDMSGYGAVPPPRTGRLQFYWSMNKPILEWDLTAYGNDLRVGECQVWGIPPHLGDIPGLSDWATVERVEVEKAYRRNGIAKWLMAEQMRFHSGRGINHLMLWVGQRNRAARKLYESLGFAYTAKLAVMEKK